MQQAGFEFEIIIPNVEEAHDATLTPEALTVENARLKAVTVAQIRPDALVIGADTLVYVDGIPLGKPNDLEEALQMLRQLSGRTHLVCTGVYLAHAGGAQGRGFHCLSQVIFQPLSDDQIRAYHALVNPLDKAGAYGIQQHSDMIIGHHEGSWTNIMGLPMERLKEELAAYDVLSTQKTF
jgi:septum formation protein